MVYRVHAEFEKSVVIVQSSPTLAVITVRHIKLRSRISPFRIGAGESSPSVLKPVVVKASDASADFFFVYRICPCRDLPFCGHLCQRPRFCPIKKGDDRETRRNQSDTENMDILVPHCYNGRITKDTLPNALFL